jgi:dihydroorotase
MRTLVRKARLLDPSSNLDEVGDLLIDGGTIAEVGGTIEAEDAQVIDADGYWLTPGFVDMHVHLREPGQEYKEDIASGGRAAVAGGFTAVACMANTEPVNDDPSVTQYILDRAKSDSPARVYPIAAATLGLKGETMTEMTALRDAGAVAFSDDGKTISDAHVMRSVLEYSRLVGLPVSIHAEDCALRADGVVNEGPVSTRLGLPGNPREAEDILVSRDLTLAKLTGAHLHVGHVSSKGAIDLIRRAREEGVQVTAEVTPHHLSLTDAETMGYDTNTKMAPPLRSQEDVDACRAALVEGVIDAIATDHAPHADHEKQVDFISAPCGILGLETAFPVVMDLVRCDELSPLELIRRLATNPAKILDRPGGTLRLGAPADLALLDPDRRWTYDPSRGCSKSRNSPWAGREMVGGSVMTFVAGQCVFEMDLGAGFP